MDDVSGRTGLVLVLELRRVEAIQFKSISSKELPLSRTAQIGRVSVCIV